MKESKHKAENKVSFLLSSSENLQTPQVQWNFVFYHRSIDARSTNITKWLTGLQTQKT